MQSEAPVQLTTIPPQPECRPSDLAIFGGGPDCRDRWNIYNQAVAQRQQEEAQLYVMRQKQLATAPLQQQIADQQGQIKKLQEQMQAQTVAASQSALAAHKEGLQTGVAIGVGASLLLFGLIYTIRRVASNFTVTKKPQARAASAS